MQCLVVNRTEIVLQAALRMADLSVSTLLDQEEPKNPLPRRAIDAADANALTTAVRQRVLFLPLPREAH